MESKWKLKCIRSQDLEAGLNFQTINAKVVLKVNESHVSTLRKKRIVEVGNITLESTTPHESTPGRKRIVLVRDIALDVLTIRAAAVVGRILAVIAATENIVAVALGVALRALVKDAIKALRALVDIALRASIVLRTNALNGIDTMCLTAIVMASPVRL